MRHCDIEYDHIRLGFFRAFDGLRAVGRFGNNDEAGLILQ
jgi:hypothetical protein